MEDCKPFDLSSLVFEGETIADYTITGTDTNWGAPLYQCIVPVEASTGQGVDIPASLEETLHRILADRMTVGDADDVLREVMGVEADSMLDDEQPRSPIDLGYALPGAITSFEPRATSQPVNDPADPLTLDTATIHGRGM